MEALARELEPPLRAVGLIRISALAGRDGETFASPQDQRAAIERVCSQRGWLLTSVFEELDVSAYRRPLDERPGLTEAVRLIEAGQAGVVVACYFDRLFRRIDVQRQVLQRVEAAGGEVYAADLGEVSHRTASRKLTATLHGAIAEYYAELVREKTLPAKERAVARGVAPFPTLIAGYRRGANGQIEVDAVTAPLVQRAFELRAEGATIMQVRDFLRASGVLVLSGKKKAHTPQPIDHTRTRTLLASRFVLGELRHGAFVNLSSHPAIVERELFERVQHIAVPRGRTAKSDRLLARLGVVRCLTCDRPLSVGAYFKPSGERVATYRCAQPDAACSAPAGINAQPLEDFVVEKLLERMRDDTGHATAATKVRQLETLLAERHAELARAIETLADFHDVPATRERLRKLRDAITEVEIQLAALPVRTGAVSRRLPAATEWPKLTLVEQRDLLRLHIERVEVAPGRGAGRVTVQFFSE